MFGLIGAARGSVLRRLIFAAAAGLACTKDGSDFLTDSSAKQIMHRVSRVPDRLCGERVLRR